MALENIILHVDCESGEVDIAEIDSLEPTSDVKLSIASTLLKVILDEWCDRKGEVDAMAAEYPNGPNASGLAAFANTCCTDPHGGPTAAKGLVNVLGC